MLKIEVKDNEGSKLYYCDGIQFQNAKDKILTRVTLFTHKAKVKSCMFMLEPDDIVMVSEDGSD